MVFKTTTLVTPRIDVPIGRVDAAGNVYASGNFLRTFFNAIIERVGGTTAPNLSDVATAVVQDETDIVALQQRTTSLEAAVLALQFQYSNLDARVTALEEAAPASDALQSAFAQTQGILKRLANEVESLQAGPQP